MKCMSVVLNSVRYNKGRHSANLYVFHVRSFLMFGPSSIWGVSLCCVFQRDQCMDRRAAVLRNVTALLIVTGQDNWNTSTENTSGPVCIYHVMSYAMFLLPSKTVTLSSTYMSLIDTAHGRCKGLCRRERTVVILEKMHHGRTPHKKVQY